MIDDDTEAKTIKNPSQVNEHLPSFLAKELSFQSC